MDRLFLDANVLFSAAYREKAGLSRLWSLRKVTLVSSWYAVAEARANLADAAQHRRLDELAKTMEWIAEPAELSESHELPGGVTLPAKDQPILAAAIRARATHLLTGDLRHFGPLMGRRVAGIHIMRPADYLAMKKTG